MLELWVYFRNKVNLFENVVMVAFLVTDNNRHLI